MSGEDTAPGMTRSERCVDMAGDLITAVAEGNDRVAGAVLKRVKRQGLQSSVLVVLALIAAGALKQAHGDQWKDRTTAFPEDLAQEGT